MLQQGQRVVALGGEEVEVQGQFASWQGKQKL